MKRYYRNGLIGLVVVALGVGAYITFYRSSPDAPQEEEQRTPLSEEVGEEVPQEGVLTERGDNLLARAIPARSSELSEAVYAELVRDVHATTGTLRSEPTNFSAWLSLALYRKALGDYEGARDTWEYVLLLDPNAFYVYQNLGNLYTAHLIDYQKAAEAYREAIAIAPQNPAAYRALFELLVLQSFYEDAEQVLREGIDKNPDALDLYVVLAEHYVSRGNTSEARSYYDSAIEQAQAAGDTELAAALSAEREQL